MISNGEISANLYSLYGTLAETGLVHSGKAGGFEYVSHPGFAWPGMAYRKSGSGPPGRDEVRLLKESMVSGNCPRLAVLGEEELTAEIQRVLAQERLIGATQWVNMALPVGREKTGRLDRATTGDGDLLECRKTDAGDPGEWSRWAAVVSGVLFKNGSLDPALFGSPAMKDQLTLVTGYAGGEAATTCLLYFGEHAGLYMVATLPMFQGKGFGRQLMEYAQSEAAARGYETVVLHSTPAGLNFYTNLGFRSFGKLFLYYSMQ